jgi:lysozyme family protein
VNFDQAFALVVGEEGALSMDPADPGNWTGGKVNVGVLKGTKYGISAASYPEEDIANLTLPAAKALAKRDYWDYFSGDTLAAQISLGLFDAGYNEGVGESTRLAQRALGLTVDGVLGKGTLTGLLNVSVPKFARQFAICRIAAYAALPGWAEEHDGWTGRVLDVYQQMVM